jgi:hypothetical protein
MTSVVFNIPYSLRGVDLGLNILVLYITVIHQLVVYGLSQRDPKPSYLCIWVESILTCLYSLYANLAEINFWLK